MILVFRCRESTGNHAPKPAAACCPDVLTADQVEYLRRGCEREAEALVAEFPNGERNTARTITRWSWEFRRVEGEWLISKLQYPEPVFLRKGRDRGTLGDSGLVLNQLSSDSW